MVSVAIKKAAQGLAKGIVTFVLSAKAVTLETKLGIHLDTTTFQAGAAAFILAGLEYVHDWAKLRFQTVKWL